MREKSHSPGTMHILIEAQGLVLLKKEVLYKKKKLVNEVGVNSNL